MQTYRYFPPGPEEQRGFVIQLAGTLVALAVVAFLFRYHPNPARTGILIGSGVALVWMLGRTAWDLEKKARRAQRALLELDDDALRVTDAEGATQVVKWTDISRYDVVGGRMTIEWPTGKLAVGARELENGLTLVREVQRHRTENAPGAAPPKPSNFIPLEPR